MGIAVVSLAALWAAALCWYDLRERRLPNALTLGGAGAALAARLGIGGVPYFIDGLAAAALAGAFLLIPFLMRGAGGGDVKMLFAAGAMTGWFGLVHMLLAMSLAGIALGLVLIVAGRLDPARMRHHILCTFNWRYDRRAGAALLPPRESESVRMPFSVPIAVGLLVSLVA